MMPALSPLDRRDLRQLLGGIKDPRIPVLLVGSHARNVPEADSDIDIAVVGDGSVERGLGRVQVIRTSEDDLVRRLENKDDFAVWLLRYGRPVRGLRAWSAMKTRLWPKAQWPHAATKRSQAFKHWQIARELAELGDEAAAVDEARVAVSHLARSVLLEHQVFPLSRPELAQQLSDLGRMNLASAASKEAPLELIMSTLTSELRQ